MTVCARLFCYYIKHDQVFAKIWGTQIFLISRISICLLSGFLVFVANFYKDKYLFCFLKQEEKSREIGTA